MRRFKKHISTSDKQAWVSDETVAKVAQEHDCVNQAPTAVALAPADEPDVSHPPDALVDAARTYLTMQKTTRLAHVLPLYAASLLINNGIAAGVFVGRRTLADGRASLVMGTQEANINDPLSSIALPSYETESLGDASSLQAFDDAAESSFVESSGDEDSDEENKDKGKDSQTKEDEAASSPKDHEGHGEGSKSEESQESKKATDKDEKGKADDESEDKKKEKEVEDEHQKHENLLASPQEQSRYIRSNMNLASKQSYAAMKSLVKVMDALNGVVALLNQIVQVAPPSQFAETVMFESLGKKLSLKGLLDQASTVRGSVDQLFTLLLSAKHSIIGNINRALPVRPSPTPPPK
ncbi:uncharacterized protein LOC113146545 [Cyclospora cayetanensis]|uniref:Uncharacterized protein LOC113146545 n=1 Tax=Cyclospora cayetanensis TaxID=88456 RepID=A0A6P6RSB5_9EIME|nr:uncharacterized protein LOC113146545 [Cyclospora cayetanensis]